MDIKYSKRNSFFILLACIVGFIGLPLMGLDTFNLELYNYFPLIPEAYIPYVSYPLFYLVLLDVRLIYLGKEYLIQILNEN